MAERHAIRKIPLHLFAVVFIFGSVIGLPLFSLWVYKSISVKRAKVLGAAVAGVSELKQAEPKIKQFDIASAHSNFKNAYAHFRGLRESLQGWNTVIKVIAPFVPKGRSYYHLSQTGFFISEIGTLLFDPILLEKAGEPPTDRLRQVLDRLQAARPLFNKARESLRQVNTLDIDEQYREDIRKLRAGLDNLGEIVDPAQETVENLIDFLGGARVKRYLLLFENAGELRPTGGFIGSLALVDIYKGEIKKIIQPGGGSYDLHYGMTQILRSPTPLHALNPRFEIQDCNWFPDFRFSAEKCAWFVETAFSTSVDGVVAITSPIVADFLGIVGAVSVPQYNVTIDANNFIPFTQVTVERARNTKNPKQLLAELFPLLIERAIVYMKSEQGTFEVVNFFIDALEKKDILLYSFDEKTEEWLTRNNWAGVIEKNEEAETTGGVITDYLHVNTATLNGGKSDFSIKQAINHTVRADDDGHVFATVEVTREHTGERLALDAKVSDIERDFNYLTAQPNVSYIRLYVPFGSQLLSVTGDLFDARQLIESKKYLLEGTVEDPLVQSVEQYPVLHEGSGTRITQEFGMTVFGNFLKVDPGTFGRLIFTYRLPIVATRGDASPPVNAYKLTVQKQSGIQSRLMVDYQGMRIYDGVLSRDIALRYLE